MPLASALPVAYVAALTCALWHVGITRHGRQPGNPVHPFTGARLVLTNNHVEAPARGPATIPLPDNDDNRGSEGIVGRVMSVIAVSRPLHLEACLG